MDSESSCMTLDKLLNLPAFPAYSSSSVSWYAYLSYAIPISICCSFTKHLHMPQCI